MTMPRRRIARAPSSSDTLPPGPSWESVAKPGFAGAALEYELRIRFTADVDWSQAQAVVAPVYTSAEGRFVAPGRTIHFSPRQLTLGVSGTSDDLPGNDEKLQTRLILLVLAELRDTVKSVGTERWTDSPFEEPPEKTREGAEGVAFLEQLTTNTFGIELAEMDYYKPRMWGGDAANPEIRILAVGPVERSIGARPNWVGTTTFLPPGRYRLTAEAPAFGLPEYRGTLKDFARAPIFVSEPLEIEGAPGEIARLRVGVPEEKRRLPRKHQAFFDQWNAETKKPPPPPLKAVVLELLAAAQDH